MRESPQDGGGARPIATPGGAPTLPSTVYAGRYALEAELGRGGMGRVFRARDQRLGRLVAVKVLAPGSHDEQQRRRFEQEARAAGALNHPNILAVHDAGEEGGEPYLVTELLEGETLRAMLSRGPLPPSRVLELASQLAQGLAAAHRRGVIHRDLKPENLFVDSEGRLKILDFGVAKLLDATSQADRVRTDAGAVIGTPAYMSPEQVRGEGADARSDVFACGIVIHEMISGKAAFDRVTSVATAWAILHEEPQAMPAGPLAAVIRRSLQKDPAERYQDAGALGDDLAAVARGMRTSAARRLRRRVMLIAVALLAAALPLSFAARRLVNDRRAGLTASLSSMAVLPFTDLSPQRDQEYFADGVAEEILNTLTRVEGLRVTGRTSSFSFKGKGEDLRTIGRKLAVEAVLEGSVRKAGTRVRIDARLVKVVDGYQVWSESYDRELTDVFAVQAEIARAVVAALEVRMRTGQAGVVPDRPATSPEAYDAYLLGKIHPEHAEAAFQRAVTLDPHWAPAWAALASAWIGSAQYVRESEQARSDRLRRSLEAAEKAVALAQQLPDGYEARAHVRTALWDWKGARADIERALALDPGRSIGHRRYAAILVLFGESAKVLEHLQKAIDLDPLSAAAWSVLGYAYVTTGQLDLARKACERTLEIAPDAPVTRWNLGEIALLEGRPADALAIFERNRLEWYRVLGRVLAQHDLGHERESREALSMLATSYGERDPYLVAAGHAWRGERDAAFEWLERALAKHAPGIGELSYDMRMRNLRDDPRFLALLARMNLPAR